jgi:hypothetical protein
MTAATTLFAPPLMRVLFRGAEVEVSPEAAIAE